jgi:molybdopterin molybdotransferase
MSQAKLLPLEVALEKLLDNIHPIKETEHIPLAHAHLRICAKSYVASINNPPFDNSAVDGYAFALRDLQQLEALPLTQRIAAGAAQERLAEGTVARIFTGAPIPLGADCVVMQENAILLDRDNRVFFITEAAVEAHQNIRPAGQDFKTGQALVDRGQVLNPQRIALLASAGIAEVEVYRPLKIAVLSTGDELVEPGTALEPGQIYNSNSYLLNAFIDTFRMTSIEFDLVADTFEQSCSTLKHAAEQADIVLTSGGASVGEADFVKQAIEELGTLRFWKIAIKPGKPFMFGEVLGTPILGLPGNPSAVFVTFLILARSVLMKRQGCERTGYQSQHYPLDFELKQSSIRREFLRVQINKDCALEKHPNQSSGMISSASWAEGFAVIKENTRPIKGELVEFIPFTSLNSFPDTLMKLPTEDTK